MLQVSYDEYDRLCEEVSRINPDMKAELPSMESLRMLRELDVSLTLGLFAYLLEHNGDADSEKEKLRYINNTILEKVEFTEAVPFRKRGPRPVPEAEYKKLTEALDSIQGAGPGALPTVRIQDALLGKSIQFCLGLGAWFLRTHRKKHKTEEYRHLRDALGKAYTLEPDPDICRVPEDKYRKSREQVLRMHFQHDDWWPTPQEIEQIIAPNFEMCYDFILWLLESEKKPVTGEQRKSARMLKELLEDRLRIMKEGEQEWL